MKIITKNLLKQALNFIQENKNWMNPNKKKMMKKKLN